MAEPYIEFRNVGKWFGAVRALHDIDLEIARGTIHGLVGENGAGKSTLGKVLAGVYRPDIGEVRVAGRRVAYSSPREALADHVTIIGQEPTLVPHRTALENVFLGIEAKRFGVVDRGMLRRRFDQLLGEIGFDLDPYERAGAMRVADQQKLEILRAIARDADVIVMDEPTAALPHQEGAQLFATVRRLREAGATIVYVSHFLEEVLALVDQVTVLRDGRLVRSTAAADDTPGSLVQSMLGRPLELTFPEKQPVSCDAPVALSVKGLARPPLVDDVSLEIRQGEVLGLAGLVGSGRSEVARALFGADRAAGEIAVQGRRVRIRHPRDGIRSGIAMVPENRKDQGLLMKRSIADNMTLPHLAGIARLGVIGERAARRSTRELLETLDVRGAGVATPVGQLSGGNQQKVLFGKWLMARPSVLIADEPTRGIDVGAKRAIYGLINSLAAQGMAVLLISSEQEEVIGLAHRVLVMRRGLIVAELTGKEMNQTAIMHAAFATTQSEQAATPA